MPSTLIRDDRYSSVAIAFHWTIAVLVLINLGLGLFHDSMPKDWPVIPVHKSIGLTVLVLTLGRLAWRLMHRPPVLASNVAPWERMTARVLHWGFYALLVIMPLTGWAMASFSKSGAPKPISWFFLFDVPHLPVTKGVAGFSHETHEILGYLMTALVVIHILAALRHHLILRNSTLHRMLPILGSPSGS